MYFATNTPVTPPAHMTTLLVAEQAGLLLGTLLDRGRDQARIERLRSGVDRDGSDVDRAVGILMAQRGCDQRDALAVLEATADAVGGRRCHDRREARVHCGHPREETAVGCCRSVARQQLDCRHRG
jgi:hypothetical protein